jgi:hypothetical protein
VTLRIERIEGRIRLSGEFRPEHVHQAKPNRPVRIASRFGFRGTWML